MNVSLSRFINTLESRTLLSTSPVDSHFVPTPPDAAIQADLNAVKAAQTALAADWKADGSAIQADEKALGAAIQAAYAALPASLTAQLKTDETTVHTDLGTLFKDIKSGASSTQIAADKAALTKAETAVQADQKTIQTDISGNSAVVAAKKKLTTDSATVVADQKVLQAAYQKLFTDWKNHA